MVRFRPYRRRLYARALTSYQLALRTPGSSPLLASSRKQTRQRPNLRYTEWGRPQRWQRFCLRVEYFGSRAALTIIDVFATNPPSYGEPRPIRSAYRLVCDTEGLPPGVTGKTSVTPGGNPSVSQVAYYFALNGKWKASSSALPSSFVLAVVTMVMSMPRVRSILS